MIKMDALRAMYISIGFHNVTTYIQSGNVVFRSDQTDAEALGQLISNAIEERFELQIPVLIREWSELKTILSLNPFINVDGEDISKLHITFLSDLSEESRLKTITGLSYPPDEFSVIGKTVYLRCPNGYGNTKLSNSFFENKLKVRATTRNLRTLNELVRIGELSI